jgi:NADPH-dependent 2,4-dienoyl-CoA reductase/sulfur reductase-like enzyme/nitrite reductase/ring-hydroxylating ferredoxin subunit
MDDTAWTQVARDADLSEGVPMVVSAGEEKVLLVRYQGAVYAVGHTCPHYQEKLEKGVLFGPEIVCKSHLARLDVTTGRTISPPAMSDLPVYPVRVEMGEVWIGPARMPGPPRAAGGADPRLILIIGAGAAGSAAAETLRRAGFAGRIVMVTREEEGPYDRPTLSKGFISGKVGEESLPLRGADFYAEQRIELLSGRTLVSLDPQRRQARFDGGHTLAFDKALIATGGDAKRLPVPGAEGCLLLRTAADARLLRDMASRHQSALLIGAGLIGLELAGSLRERGLEVTVVAREDFPLASLLGERVSRHIRSLYEAQGVTFLMGRTPLHIGGPAGARQVTLSDGTRVQAGFVVMGVGIAPALDCLHGSGLAENGAVPVDARMQTRAPDIFAAGDIAAAPDADGGVRRVEHWASAQRQGMRAALCMLGADPGPVEPGFFWSRQAGVSLKYLGHAGSFDTVAYRGVVEEGKFLAGYYRGGVLKAAATMGLAQDLVGIEQLMRRGKAPDAALLSDAGWDIVTAAQRA